MQVLHTMNPPIIHGDIKAVSAHFPALASSYAQVHSSGQRFHRCLWKPSDCGLWSISSESDPVVIRCYSLMCIAQVVEDITGIPFTQSRGVSDSYRWFAPEVCVGQGALSLNADIYAYAMTALEVGILPQ